MDDGGVRAVAENFRLLFHLLHEGFRDQVLGLDHGTLNWRPLPKANSIAVLVTHSLGSEREMLHSVRRVVTERDRDSEFRAEAEAADLLALLDQADREVDELLGGLTAGDLTEDRPRGESSAHLPPTAFVNFLQNHDQIANSARGVSMSAEVRSEADRKRNSLGGIGGWRSSMCTLPRQVERCTVLGPKPQGETVIPLIAS